MQSYDFVEKVKSCHVIVNILKHVHIHCTDQICHQTMKIYNDKLKTQSARYRETFVNRKDFI